MNHLAGVVHQLIGKSFCGLQGTHSGIELIPPPASAGHLEEQPNKIKYRRT
jgi:hypothetical protein